MYLRSVQSVTKNQCYDTLYGLKDKASNRHRVFLVFLYVLKLKETFLVFLLLLFFISSSFFLPNKVKTSLKHSHETIPLQIGNLNHIRHNINIYVLFCSMLKVCCCYLTSRCMIFLFILH